MPSEDTEEARRQRSDDARRAALRERIERQKVRDRQIADDIANVDKKTTKRTVFADSDEDEEADKGDKKNTPKSSSTSSSKRPKLFDSEDEKDDGDGDDDVINEKTLVNRHTGAKGEKLMKLESRFNADPRFKLDDKFAESDSDEGGDPVLTAEKSEMKQEKDKNRELLSKILGKSVEEKKPKQTSDASGALLKARPFTRFDPENPEHLEWMKAFEAAKNPKSQVKTAEKEEEKEEGDGDKEADNEDDDGDKSDEDFEKTEMFFKMDDQFAEEMKERKETGPASTGGFSFLSMMGRKYEDEKESDEDAETEEEAPKPAKKVEKLEKTAEKPKKVASGPILKTKPAISGAFFVDPFKDEKIQSMAANFRRTQTVEKIIDKWAPHRDAIFKLWKKQRRDAVKKQKDAFFTNGRQRKRKIEENGDKNEEK